MEELTFRVLPTLQVVHHLVPLKSFRSFQPSIGICHPGVAMGWCDSHFVATKTLEWMNWKNPWDFEVVQFPAIYFFQTTCFVIEGGPFFGPRPKIGRVGMEPRKLSGEHGVDWGGGRRAPWHIWSWLNRSWNWRISKTVATWTCCGSTMPKSQVVQSIRFEMIVWIV